MNIYRYMASTGPAKCGLTVKEFGRTRAISQIVVLTELASNPGMSVTNAYEDIATHLVKERNLDPFRVIWFEHYPAEGQRKESFDLVTLTWKMRRAGWLARSPEWHRVSEKLVMELLGENKR